LRVVRIYTATRSTTRLLLLGPIWLQRLSDISPLKHVVNGVRALFRGDISSSASLWGSGSCCSQ
jgi:hypothetical protein